MFVIFTNMIKFNFSCSELFYYIFLLILIFLNENNLTNYFCCTILVLGFMTLIELSIILIEATLTEF